MATYYTADDAVTLTGVEANFLTGPWSADTRWAPDHEGFEHETQGARLAERASPSSSPAGPGCCSC